VIAEGGTFKLSGQPPRVAHSDASPSEHYWNPASTHGSAMVKAAWHRRRDGFLHRAEPWAVFYWLDLPGADCGSMAMAYAVVDDFGTLQIIGGLS